MQEQEPDTIIDNENSVLHGKGYGWGHQWQLRKTNRTKTEMVWDEGIESYIARNRPLSAQEKWSRYKCRTCGAKFKHYYDLEPDIFEAIKKAGIPNTCNHKCV